MSLIKTTTTYLTVAIVALSMIVPIHLTHASVFTSKQTTQLQQALAELVVSIQGLKSVLATEVVVGTVLGVSVSNNQPIIDGETVVVNLSPEVVRGTASTDKAIIQSSDGVRIEALNRSAETGRELGILSEQPAYAVYEQGKTVDFNGTDVVAAYWSINGNQISRDDETPLSGTALETTLRFGSVLVDVEVVEGTPGRDFFSGRSADDYFIPGFDNDYFNGSKGDDTVQFIGTLREYTITANDNGTHVVAGPDGTNRIVGVETFVFADGTFTPDEAVAILAGENTEVIVSEPIIETDSASAEETTEAEAGNALRFGANDCIEIWNHPRGS